MAWRTATTTACCIGERCTAPSHRIALHRRTASHCTVAPHRTAPSHRIALHRRSAHPSLYHCCARRCARRCARADCAARLCVGVTQRPQAAEPSHQPRGRAEARGLWTGARLRPARPQLHARGGDAVVPPSRRPPGQQVWRASLSHRVPPSSWPRLPWQRAITRIAALWPCRKYSTPVDIWSIGCIFAGVCVRW